MAGIPARITDRLASGLKRFQPIISSAVARDVNESDTVMIITDMLSEIFGYDKYSEVTREFAIRGTCVDLAIKIEGKLRLLIEVKAVGLELKDQHVKQAIDYAANQGIDWAVLTNAKCWQIYRVSFVKPIECELILEFNILDLNPKKTEHLENLYLISRDSLMKSALDEYHIHRQSLNRFTIAAIILSEPSLEVVQRELKRLSPGLKIDLEEIKSIVESEVLKREVVEGEKSEEATKKIAKSQKKQSNSKRERSTEPIEPDEKAVEIEPPAQDETTMQTDLRE